MSAKEQPLEIAKGKVKTIAVNESWRLAPWADVLFGVDWEWWRARKGVPEFQGIKIGWNLRGFTTCGIREIVLSEKRHEILMDERGVLGKANSGFAAINLAIQFGAKRLILVGYDCCLGMETHWHGRHENGLRNPQARTAERWAEKIDGQADRLRELGVQVFNCSPISTLKNYPVVTLEEALHACGALGQANHDTAQVYNAGCSGAADRDMDSTRAIEAPSLCEAS